MEMGALSAMNDTFRFFQKRYTDLVIPAAEGYLIMMAMQLLMIPILVLLIFPLMLIPVIGVDGIVSIAVLIIVIYLISIGGTSLAMGIMYGGMVRAIDDLRNQRKVKFGEMFKYGWRNKWELFTIQFLNMIIYMILNFSIMGMVFIFGWIIINQDLVAGLIFIFLMMMVVSFMLYALIPLQYLPFVVRHKRGTYGAENIVMAWKEFFTDIVTYSTIGFMYMILMVLFMFIPIINMIVALALHPAFISTLLIYYDEKYRVPVMPEPIKFEPHPPYQQHYPADPQTPQNPYYAQYSDRY